jgi:hypothetical protein
MQREIERKVRPDRFKYGRASRGSSLIRSTLSRSLAPSWRCAVAILLLVFGVAVRDFSQSWGVTATGSVGEHNEE